MSLDVPYTWHIPHAPREAFADANMNVLKAAKALEIHPNTMSKDDFSPATPR